jgi:hypothetical protein
MLLVLLAQTHEPPWWAFVAFFAIVLVFALVAKKRGPNVFARFLERNRMARGCGLGVALFGCFFGYLIVYEPLADVLSHRQQVTVHRGTVALTALFVFFGAVLLLAGPQWTKFLPTRRGQSPTGLQAATLAVALIVCLGFECGFWALLDRLGYKPLF